jgi:hypothetical protein
VAVGPSHVVQAVNSLVRVTDRKGTNLGQATAAALFGVLAGQIVDSDPHVVYDAQHGRWLGTYISFDCTNGYLYVIESQTADPTGVWNGWYFTFPGVLPDQPDIGISSDKVAIAQNEYSIVPSGASCDGNASPNGSSILVLDWADLLAGVIPSDAYFSADPGIFEWRPARNLTSDPTIYLVAEGSSSGDVLFDTIVGTVAGSNTTLNAVVDMTTTNSMPAFGNGPPPAPRQPGSPATIAQAVDERPTDALWAGGSLWFTATLGCVPPGDSVVRDCTRVSQVLTTSPTNPTIRQDFALGFNGYDTFMGGIGLTENGAAHLVYSTSSSSAYVSTWTNAQAVGDAPNTIRPTVALASGGGTYGGSRWGDYVGVATDPALAGAVWEADEYANASRAWSTTVSELYIDTTPPNGTFSINGGAASTVTPQVTLSDSATDDASGVASVGVSNDGSTWATIPYATLIPWNLTDPTYGGTAAPGMKTVYMKWLDNSGNWSSATTRSISLASGATYHPVTPARILDTRNGTGLAGSFSSGVARTFTVAGQGGVPASAVAVTGNLTVTQQSQPGYVALTPSPTNSPSTSTLNFPLVDNRANGVTVPLSGDGHLSATYITGRAGDHTALIFDVTGYFTP